MQILFTESGVGPEHLHLHLPDEADAANTGLSFEKVSRL